VHSARLEGLGEGLVVCSADTVATHWVDEPVAEASVFGSLDPAPESLVTTSGMGDAINALADKPYSGF
jgi:hypothetical protein